MKLSPEFLRNVWLELTPHRLLGMPAILAATFFLTFLIANDHYAVAWRWTALILYFLLTLLWGTRLAGDALVNEVKDNTWDQQRLSAIPPWSMAWGKLFGSTVFTWYGGSMCLIMFFIASTLGNQVDVIKQTLLMIAIGVLGQAVALLTSLQSTVRKIIHNRSAATSFMLVGLLASFPFISLGLQNKEAVQWYGELYQPLNFFLLLLSSFCCWALIAIYRRLRHELQFRNTPLVWLTFCIFVAILLPGFINDPNLPPQKMHNVRLFVAYLTLVGLCYSMIFLEVKDPILIRRLLVVWRNAQWRRLLELIPCWLVSLASVLLLCLYLLLATTNSQVGPGQGMAVKPLVVAMGLFLLRDVLLFVYFNLGKRRQRADMAALLYLAVLYWLLPSILAGMELNALVALFIPTGDPQLPLSILSALIQAIVLLFLCRTRWQTFFAGQQHMS